MRWGLTILLSWATLACPSQAKPKKTTKTTHSPSAAAEAPSWATAFAHQIHYDRSSESLVASIRIAPGFHAYTTGEEIGKPLTLSFNKASACSPNGEIEYPPGRTKQLPIGKSVIVEDEAQIVAPLLCKGDGELFAKGSLRYQICTDSACDRPRKVEFSLPITN